MSFIEKVASYFQTYENSSAKEGLLKIAAEDGVTADDLVAYHNLVYGNIFTGKNLLKTASENPESKIIAIGTAFDKVASGEMTPEEVVAYANELGMTKEDVDFIYAQIEKQAQEAGVIESESNENDEELTDKVAEAMDFLDANGIDPISGLIIAANVNEEGLIADEKVAEEAVEAGFTEEDLTKIAEVVEFLGSVDEKVLATAEELFAAAHQE